jgi:hypothetical protein
MTRFEILKEIEEIRASKIDPAYWRFTRQANGLPPSMQEPGAFDRLTQLLEML